MALRVRKESSVRARLYAGAFHLLCLYTGIAVLIE